MADTDGDGDTTADCNDGCPSDAAKIAPGICGCGVADADGDGDTTADCNDGCPSDAAKVAAGICGCGVADTDGDGDMTADCNDGCPSDAAKVAAGICGCGVADADGDGDMTADCNDGCPSDAAKVAAGICGCGVADTDGDGDTTADCDDLCPGHDDRSDSDLDGIPDGCDAWTVCAPGAVGVGVYDGSVTIGGPDGVPIGSLAGISCVTGGLHVIDSDLPDLSGLSSLQAIGGPLHVLDNDSLTSLSGLENLTSAAQGLWIENNPLLASLSGLENLTSIGQSNPYPDGRLAIRDNAQLPACWTWLISAQSGETCGSEWGPCSGNTGTGSCGALPPGFVCEPGAEGPGVYQGSLTIGAAGGMFGSVIVLPEELGGLACVTEDLTIWASTLTDFDALASLQVIGGYLRAVYNTSLTSFDGLENLTSIGYGLEVRGNASLASLGALSSLTHIAETNPAPGSLELLIRDNAALPACWVETIELQGALECGYYDGYSGWLDCSGNEGAGSCGP